MILFNETEMGRNVFNRLQQFFHLKIGQTLTMATISICRNYEVSQLKAALAKAPSDPERMYVVLDDAY